MKFTIAHPYSQVKIPVVINGHRLISLVQLSMYRWDFIQQLPYALSSAIKGDLGPLSPMVEALSWYYIDKDWNDALFTSVVCSENRIDITRDSLVHQVKAYPRLIEYLRPMWTNHPCDYWEVPKVPAQYHRPVKTVIPILLLSGSYDPATPPSWAEKTKPHFTNAYSFEFSGIGHGTIGSDVCAQEVMKQFLFDQPDLQRVSCTGESQRPTFIIQ